MTFRQLPLILFAFALTLSAANLRFDFPADAEPAGVKIQRVIRNVASTDALVAELPGDGQSAFYQMDVQWPLREIRQIEFTAMTCQPGFFRLGANVAHADGTKESLHVSPQMAVPDGEFHTFVFKLPVFEDPEMVLTNWELRWHGAPGIVGLASLATVAESNFIPNARRLKAAQEHPLDALKPHATYLLRWEGERSPNIDIRFYDKQLKEFPGTAVHFEAGERELRFTTPELLIQARLTLDGKSEGHPVLTLEDYHFPFAPYGKWRGKWIWSRPMDTGPYKALVWFQRDFDLPENIEYGAIAWLADDNAEWFINGESVGRSIIWTTPEQREITAFLRPGHNRITVRTWNGTQAGGLAGDVYVKANGQEFRFDTDEQWTCTEAASHTLGNTPIDQPVVVYGAPETTAPWFRNIDYRYAGPKGQLQLLEATPGEMRVLVKSAPPHPGRELHFTLVSPDGTSRAVRLCVTPDMGEWQAGQEVVVHYPIPYLEEGQATLRLSDEYVEIDGNPALAEFAVPHREAPAIQQASLDTTGRPALLLGDVRHDATFWHCIATDRTKRYYELQIAADAGLKSYRVEADFLDFWKAEDEFDFSVLDNNIAQVLTVCPDAIFCIHTYAHMPDWWLEANPDETSAHGDGGPRKIDREKQSLSSKKWLADAEVAIRILIDHLKAKPYADRIWGMSVSENGNGEWFWMNNDLNMNPSWAGWAPCDTRNFRDFLRKRYGTDKALAAAWHQEGLTFETAELPEPGSEKNASLGGEMLDPVRDQPVIDWFAWRNDALGQAICHFAHVVKDATDGKWLAGFYYAYNTELASNPGLNIQMTGHNGFLEVARCPDVDFVHGPSRYTHRRIGMADGLMQTWDTFLLHGKQVYCEQDVRLSYAPAEPDNMKMYVAEPESALESVGQMNRVLGMQLATGTLTYWFDLVHGSFYEPALAQLMTEQAAVTDELPPAQGLTPVEVAIVGDRESLYYSRANTYTGIFRAAIEGTFQRFNELAAPYHSLVIDDLLEEAVHAPAHRLYVMLPTLVLTADQRTALMERFEREHATVVWLHCAGATYPGQTPSSQSNADFLGIRTELHDVRECPEMTTTPKYGAVHCVNFAESGPWFLPVAGFDEVVATKPDGAPMMVRKTIGNATHYYCALMNLPPEAYATILDKTGVWRYHFGLKDPVWAGNDVVCLHAGIGGAKRLNLRPGTQARGIIGPFQGILRNGDSFEAVAGMTYGFLLEPAE